MKSRLDPNLLKLAKSQFREKLKLSVVKLSLENWVKQPTIYVPGYI